MNLKFTRSDKETGYRIMVYPGTGKQTEGVHTVKFKFYADKAKPDGTIDWLAGKGYVNANRVASDNIDGSYDLTSLLANKWYDIEFKFDLETTNKSYLKVTDIATGNVVIDESLAIKGTNGFTNMWMYLVYPTDTTVSNLLLFKDYQVMADFGEQKGVIRYIGNDNVVDYGQNVVTFKISENNGLTKDNIRVTDSQGNVIKAKSMSVTEDMGEYIVTATMEKDLSSNKTYTLNQFYSAPVANDDFGTLAYKLYDLNEGEHVLTLRAWDIFNNSNTETIRFNVVKGKIISIENVSNYPNPMSDNTNFVFEHNQKDNEIDIEIRIYDVMGQLVRTIKESSYGTTTRSNPIRWDGRADSGATLKSGVYMYNVRIKNAQNEETSGYSKLIIK